jgi:hypothetical protein
MKKIYFFVNFSRCREFCLKKSVNKLEINVWKKLCYKNFKKFHWLIFPMFGTKKTQLIKVLVIDHDQHNWTKIFENHQEKDGFKFEVDQAEW